MATNHSKDLMDIPVTPARVAQNRDDPKQGEGPFVRLVSPRAAEQVNLNGLTWNNTHMEMVAYEESTRPYPMGDARVQGNRSTDNTYGGNKLVNYPAWPRRVRGGNDSGE